MTQSSRTTLTGDALWAFVKGMRVAAQQCVQVGRALQPLIAPKFKAPDSPYQTSTTVTLADRLLQDVLILRALALMPDLRVYSEELDACPAELGALFTDNDSRYELVLDPIDGSDDYAAGRDTWGVMVGLLDVETERLVAGLIHLADHATYCAVRGGGAQFAEGLGSPLAPLDQPNAPRSLGRTKRLSEHDYAAAECAGIQIVDASSRSCAVELVRMLRGELGVVAMRHFHGHDSAMGALMAEALGGAALAAGGQPVRYESDMPRLPLVVISTDSELAHELVAAMADHDEA